MSNEELPVGAEVDRIHESLSEGLKSCQAMIANYRSLLLADPSRFAANSEAEFSSIQDHATKADD